MRSHQPGPRTERLPTLLCWAALRLQGDPALQNRWLEGVLMLLGMTVVHQPVEASSVQAAAAHRDSAPRTKQAGQVHRRRCPPQLSPSGQPPPRVRWHAGNQSWRVIPDEIFSAVAEKLPRADVG